MEELCLSQAVKIIEDNLHKIGVVKKYDSCNSEDDFKVLALEIIEKEENCGK